MNALDTLKELDSRHWTRNQYKSGSRYCAVGWLAYKAGYTPLDDDPYGYEPSIANSVVREKYGLSYDDITVIIELNDSGLPLAKVKEGVAQLLRG